MQKTIYSLFIFIIIFTNIYSQNDTNSIHFKYTNSICITTLGTGIVGSVGYGSIIKEYKRSYLVGYFQYSPTYNFGVNFEGFLVGYNIFDYFGKGNHHLVLGIGYYFLKSFYDSYDGYKTNWRIIYKTMPNFDIGYSYWDPNRRFSYKFSIHPLLSTASFDIFPLWTGITVAYNFKIKNQILKFNKTQHGNSAKDRFEIGNESDIGIGKTSLKGIGEKKGITINNNLYLKYYLSRFYLKANAGITYLTFHQIESSNIIFSIYDYNPYFINFGFGAGFIIFNRNNWQLETGVNFGNYFSKNTMIIRAENLPYYESNRNDYSLYNEKHDHFYSDKPFLISPEINLYKNLNKNLKILLCVKYSLNYYQYAVYNSYRLKCNELNIGIGIQYNLKGKNE